MFTFYCASVKSVRYAKGTRSYVLTSLDISNSNLCQCDVAAICERSDDETWRISKVFVVVKELRVADVGEAVV